MTPERGPEGLRVGAITSFTTIDFPGKLAAVAFIQGCPWDCTYCQNPWLRPFKFDPQYEHESWESLIALLSRRKGLLDGVVFSGGEPLSDPALPAAIKAVKSQGFLVAVHTSGAYPAVLKEILPDIDWVGLISRHRSLILRLSGTLSGLAQGKRKRSTVWIF